MRAANESEVAEAHGAVNDKFRYASQKDKVSWTFLVEIYKIIWLQFMCPHEHHPHTFF